jgi:group I intron endonuclease
MFVKKWYFVYQTLNLINGKIYVGVHTSLVNPKKKFDGYLGKGTYLSKDILKYGKDNFRRTVIKICDSKEEAVELERSIVNTEFLSSANVYNIHRGGAGCVSHSEVSRKIMSVSRKGSGNNMFGKEHSKITKSKMSSSHKGKVIDTETRKKMGISKNGSLNGMFGVKRERFECSVCGKQTDAANMARWHGANCRSNVNN